MTPDDVVSSGHGVEAFDNEAWKNKRMEWARAMWDPEVRQGYEEE